MRVFKTVHNALGFKELWEIPSGLVNPGSVWHGFGYPLKGYASGGNWLYGLSEKQISIGQVVNLNYVNPEYDPFLAFQQFKSHPIIQPILKQSKRLSYGARTIPEGGYWSRPQPYANGAMIIGDSAGFLDSKRLKGIHLAIKSGILAAQTAFEALKQNNYSDNILNTFEQKINESYIGQSLWKARNHHSAITRGGLLGTVDIVIQQPSNGRGLFDKGASRQHKANFEKKSQAPIQHSSQDTHVVTSKTESLFFASNAYTDNQPVHVKISEPDICVQQCTQEYGNPCQYFCPANVFVIEKNNAGIQLKLNPANCLQCQTCAILDPYKIINWQPPEGGDGPRYEGM